MRLVSLHVGVLTSEGRVAAMVRKGRHEGYREAAAGNRHDDVERKGTRRGLGARKRSL